MVARDGAEELVERFLAGYSERTRRAYATDLEAFALQADGSMLIHSSNAETGPAQPGGPDPAAGGQ